MTSKHAALAVILVCSIGLAAPQMAAPADSTLPHNAQPGDGADQPLGPEDPAIQALAIRTYAEQYGVPEQRARRVLGIQHRASRLNSKLREELGGRYGGVWFDAETATFRAGVAGEDGSGRERARSKVIDVLESRGLTADSRVLDVRSSEDELLSAQRALVTRLNGLITDGQATTAIDPSKNAVVVEVASDLTASERRELDAAISDSSADVAVHQGERESLHYTTLACISGYVFVCDRPFRGGTWINGASGCTGGFIARMNPPDYSYRLVTAGHCVTPSNALWNSYTSPTSGSHYGDIGYRTHWHWGAGGDVGAIRIEHGRYFYGITNPCCQYPVPKVGVPASGHTGAVDMYHIGAEGSSYVGLYLCVTSAFVLATNSFGTCGTVNQLNYNGTNLTKACTATPLVPGSSGGPWYIANSAYGVTSGAVPGTCDALYTESTAAENLLGVYILHAAW